MPPPEPRPAEGDERIETCRAVALGGHVARCQDCAHITVAYNSCRDRHCPKCQAAAAKEWLQARETELLPVPYFHLVFTLSHEIAAIAYQNKAVVYDVLFSASSETMLTIAADPKHLGATIGIIAVLQTGGSAMAHHPHVHMIVPGGGISSDRTRWIAARPDLAKLFRRLMLEKLVAAHATGKRQFFGKHADLANHKHSPPPKRRCVTQSDSSIASGRAPDFRPCTLICPPTPTASPSPTVGWSRSTTAA
jgi:hypothetical protein